MMDNNQINQKIETALSSLDGIQRAEADDALYEGILHRLDEKRIKVSTIVPMHTVWLAAASFAIIVSLNVVLLVTNNPDNGHHSAASAIAQTYFNQNP
jgi:hypothetical protein